MITYAAKLETAKHMALAALTDLLATTEDPIEKRRIAVAILRVPDPKPDRAAPNRATGCPGFDGQPVQATPDSRTPETYPPPESPTQDPGPRTQDASSPSPHLTSDITHLTSPSLPPLSSLDARLDALHAELDHHLANLLTTHLPLCASASLRETLPESDP